MGFALLASEIRVQCGGWSGRSLRHGKQLHRSLLVVGSGAFVGIRVRKMAFVLAFRLHQDFQLGFCCYSRQ
jgi:hypothetical protein